MTDRDFLLKEAEKLGLVLDADALRRLDIYAKLLVEWNQRMNLTAITDPEGIAVRHFLDSMTVLTAFDARQGASFIDVGSGAGFPGMVLKIVRPDLSAVLMDGTGKRVRFLETLSAELGLSVKAVHARAEEAARKPEFREKFDFATARAVSALRVLAEYTLGFVKVGGLLVAMKGPSGADELAEAETAISKMGAVADGISALKLPDSSERLLIRVKKSSQTPTIYPRPSAKIAKIPL